MNISAMEQAIAKKRERIAQLSVVSQDTAYRESFELSAMVRALDAAKEDKVFLSGEAKGVLILGISALGQEKADRFIRACGGWKSHSNGALTLLDGEQGEIRKNQAGSCWIIDLASPRRVVMFAWETGPRQIRLGGPRLNTTNGAAHWCGLLSASTPLDPERNQHSIAFVQQAMACMAEHGMTPRQWAEAENARNCAEAKRRNEIQAAVELACSGRDAYWLRHNEDKALVMAKEIAGETGPVPADLADKLRTQIAAQEQAAEDARIMAELEAEQAKLAAEKAAAEAEAKRQAEILRTCQTAGIAPEAWTAMTPKQQGLALHRARLAHKI